jgi:hypothetical protein
VEHFDLSYFAFEQLIHPVYGVGMVEYRTVDCDTGAPLPQGFIDRTALYCGGVRPGWGYQAYASSDTQIVTSGERCTRLAVWLLQTISQQDPVSIMYSLVLLFNRVVIIRRLASAMTQRHNTDCKAVSVCTGLKPLTHASRCAGFSWLEDHVYVWLMYDCPAAVTLSSAPV